MGSFGACLIAVGLGLVSAGTARANCVETTIDLRGPSGAQRFTIEVADDVAEQSEGLMFREKMAASAGMLFVFPQPKRAQFWMRNTLIPLDMIFADGTGLVTRVHANAVPGDETAIDGGDGVVFVLEINGGLAARMGIAAGSQMRHPKIAQTTAIWPCLGE